MKPSTVALLCFMCVGGHGAEESTSQHFQRHRWLLTVYSVGNFTHAGHRFGSQIQVHMEGAWVAKQLGLGWVRTCVCVCVCVSVCVSVCVDCLTKRWIEMSMGYLQVATDADDVACPQVAPDFVHQPRDSRVAEDMTDRGTITADEHPYIITTEATSGEDLFSWTHQDFASHNPGFLTLAQLHTASNATIDHLLVYGRQAGVIGGQACADPRACSNFKCPVLAHDGGGARAMEFYGRQFWVKRVFRLAFL